MFKEVIHNTHCRTFSLHYVLLGIIILFSGYLIFKNLGDASLWVDEAETAIIAKNFLKTGHFTGWDGRNLFALRNGACLKKDLHDANPPLQFLLTALSFSLFGENNFSARLPFAIIGLMTVFLLYWYLRTEFAERRNIALYGAAFLGLFVEYILYTRNCRYYSITCFAALLTFFAYRNYIRHLDMKSALGLAAAAVLLYYSHFQICIAFLIPLAVVYLFIDRKYIPAKPWPQLLFVCFIFTLATLPYTIAYRLWERPDLPHVLLLNRVTILLWYLRDSLGTGIAPWSILAASAVLIIARLYDFKTRYLVKITLCIVLGHIIVVALTTLQNTPENLPLANIRYCVACFPFTAILAALFFNWIHQKSKPIALIIALLLINSNLSYIFFGQQNKYDLPHSVVYFPLYKYLYEIHHHYPTATSKAADFLKKNANQDDTYYAIPEYENDPLHFYIGSRLINSCVLNRDTYLGAERMKSLSPCLLKEENFPNWLIFFGKIITEQKTLRYFSRTFDRQGALFNYDYALDTIIPVYWKQANRPEIYLHNFGEVTGSVLCKRVFIFQKVKDDPADWLLHFPQILSGARTWDELDLCVKILQKFYEMNLHDSLLVNKKYSKTQVVGFFWQYMQLLFTYKRFPEAERVCRTAIRLEPYNGGNYYWLAKVLLKEEQYDNAIVLCSSLINNFPKMHLLYLLKAEAYERQRKPDKAIDILTNCLNVISDANDKEKVRVELERLRYLKQKDK